MRNTSLLLLAFMLIFNVYISQAVEPVITPVGEWLFDDATDLTKSSFGPALSLVGSHTAIAGPNAGDKAVRIGKGSHYRLMLGIKSNKGTYVNTYSLLFDFRVKDLNSWVAFLQTDAANSDDAEIFIHTGKGTIGINPTGYSTKTVIPTAWNRLIAVVNNGTEYSLYLNGEKILTGTVQSVDSKFALRPTILLFGDNDGEDGEIDVARVSLYDRALTASEATAFGGYEQPEIPKKAFLAKPYLQNATTDGMTIMWESDYSTVGTVYYGLSGNSGNSVTSTVTKTNANTYIHKARIGSLQEHTKYSYQVVASTDSITDPKTFISATSDPNTSFKVGIWGDSHYVNPFSKMASFMVDNLKIDFGFSSGDISNTGNTRTDLATVFIPEILGSIGSKIPFYVAMGNHDAGSHWGGGNLIRQYVDQPTENNSDADNFDGSFAYSYGNSVFISIDWNRMEADVIPGAWLEKFLKSSTSTQAKFRFIFIHNAPFYERWQTAENATIKKNLPILCAKYGVNAVFSGHMHGYERGLIEGVQYITQGGASYLDISETVGPTIYPHIVVGTNKSGNPSNFGNGMTNHIVTLDVTADKATAKLHYFDGTGEYLGVIESVDMLPRVPTQKTEISSDLNFSISPNPSKGSLDILAPSNINVSIFSMNGKIVFSKENIHKKSKLDISALEKGTYLIKLHAKKSEYSKTIFLN